MTHTTTNYEKAIAIMADKEHFRVTKTQVFTDNPRAEITSFCIRGGVSKEYLDKYLACIYKEILYNGKEIVYPATRMKLTYEDR